MARCLCCNKEINSQSKNRLWHDSCVKKFFYSTTLPLIDLDEEKMEQYALHDVSTHITIPGVQKKLSLHLSTIHSSRLTLINYKKGYILKPQTNDYLNLPELEFLGMTLAKVVGIQTVPFGLIELKNGSLAYITRRIDRIIDNDGTIKKIAMEDFCQLDNRLTVDKYKGSYERCAKIIQKYSSKPLFDLSELFLRIVFSFIIGNSDMHLKNFSLIASSNNKYELSKAYDILPVSIVLKDDLDELALTIDGKKRNLTKNTFYHFASSISLPKSSSEKIMKFLINKKEIIIDTIKSSLISEEYKKSFIKLVEERIEILK